MKTKKQHKHYSAVSASLLLLFAIRLRDVPRVPGLQRFVCLEHSLTDFIIAGTPGGGAYRYMHNMGCILRGCVAASAYGYTLYVRGRPAVGSGLYLLR
jgi:hypothetical protein